MGQYAYDALVVEHLKSGSTLESALKLAGAAYPEEQLAPVTEEHWEAVSAHYGCMTDFDFEIRQP